MSATPYEREFNFSDFQASSPADPLPAPHIDAEFNRVKLTFDGIMADADKIQNDDGSLKPVVGYDQLTGQLAEDMNDVQGIADRIAVAETDIDNIENTLTTKITSVVAGARVAVDNTDPQNPVISVSGAGTGDVLGPASAADASVAGYNGTTGKSLKQLSAAEIRAAAGLATTDSPQFAGVNLGNASDTTLTRSAAGKLAVEGVDVLLATNDIAIPVVVTVPNTGLHLLDINASHDLIVKPGSDLTADRTFTLTTGDANRALNISAADVTISAFAATLLDDADAAAARSTLGIANSAMVYLGQVVLSAQTSAEFINLDNTLYDEIIFKIVDLYHGTSNQVQVVVSTDNGSSYISTGYYESAVIGGTTPSGFESINNGVMRVSNANNTNNGSGLFGTINAFIGDAQGYAQQSLVSYRSTNGRIASGGGVALSGTKVNAIKIQSSQSMTGKIMAYGVKNS